MNRDEIEAENAELRDMLVAAYRELQRHGVKSVPLSSESVHRGASPTDWRCRCVTRPVPATADDVEKYIRSLDWSEGTTDRERTLVAGNIRGFHRWLFPDCRLGATHEAAPISQAAWASLDPKEYTPVHNAVLRFLWGTAPYNGLWFHEAGARAHGSYWWRKYLPKPEGGEDA